MTAGDTPRVVALRALGLGDFLTGVPAYRALRRGFPDHEIVLAAPAGLAPLVPLTGAIDRLVPAGELEAVQLSGPPPAVGVDLHGRGPRSHRIVARLNPERMICFASAAGTDGSREGYQGSEWLPQEHEAMRWCRLLAESGVPGALPPTAVRLADDLAFDLTALPPWAGRGLPLADRAVVVHPGAASGSRRWPPERYALVVRELTRRGHRVVITGTAAERRLAQRVAEWAGLGESAVLAGHTPLIDLVALIAEASLVICGDTGVAHLATACGTRSVVLFGPVPPSEWGPPPSGRHIALWPATAGYHGDPHSASVDPTLARITPGHVLAAMGCVRLPPGPAGSRAPYATDHEERAPWTNGVTTRSSGNSTPTESTHASRP